MNREKVGRVEDTRAIESIEAIDVHAHYGAFANRSNALSNQFMSGDAAVILQRAAQARTAISIVSPLQALMPRFGGDPVGGNEDAFRIVAAHPGLMQWVVVDPLHPETYAQAARMLADSQCAGLKIHPEEHGYAIREHGCALFEFAARHDAAVLTHSGEANSLPRDFVPFADQFPNARLILAHLGCGFDGDPTHQVRAVQAAKHGNVWVDTSSAQSLIPNLIEWAVREIGADRLLYGTDTPLYFAPCQRARIDKAEIGDAEKRLILRDNARQILRLEALLP